MKISYNPKSSQTAINTETAANDDIIFDLYASKLWAKGVRIGADWADITSKPSSLKNPAAIKFKDINGNVVTYDGSVAKDLTSGTYMANRLTTARNIALGTDLRGSANFDGSGNITINANINACTVSVGSTDTLPFKRIAHFETTNNYNDNALLLYISEGYINGRSGICRVEFRTDNISSSSTSISASVAVRWLVRNGYGLNALYAGYYVTAGKAYIDIYLKTAGGYRGTVIRVLQDSRGGINSNVQLISARYNNENDHKEAYSSIEAAATALYNKAYTRIVSGSDVGTVSYANSTGSTTKLQTARKLWGQSFDGTKDISGALSGTGNIAPGSAAAFDIGSNSLDYRYGYFQWIGAKSGTNLRLAANNSDNQIVLHINGNVGIGTNSPAYKLDVRGNTGISGSIIFPTINDTAISSKISWSGSSEGADIYYQTTAKDQGNLVLNVKDDNNAYIQLALNGTFKSHFDVANSYWTGRSALADKWTTARTFTIGNTAKNVDGSGNVSWSLSEIGVRDTWRTVQVNGTSIGNNTLNLCGSTYIGLTNVDGKVTFSLVGSSTTANQAILSNGTVNGWALKTLNIANWDAAYNLRHSHANKSVLDGITSGSVSNWNTAYTFVHTITGTDTDNVINKWDEIVNFLAGITEDNKLNTLLNSKLSVYKLADKTNVGAIKNNGIYYSTTDASSGTLTNSPFNNGFTLINMTSLDGDDDLRRSRLAFNAFGEIKVSDDRDQANTAETWYNVLTSKNSGISGSTIKLNGTSITVYSSGTADGRYVKKSGDTMTGALNFANGTWNKVGDDIYMGDHNIGGQLCLMGITGNTGISFHKQGDASIRKSITFNGSTLYMNGNCDYASLANQSNLLAMNTVPNKTTSTSVGSWSPISGRYVFHQRWTDTSTGSDGADFGIYLDGNLTANMVLDGYYNSLSGFRVIGAKGGFLKANGTIDNSTYLTSHQSLSNYYTKGEINTKLSGYLPLSGGTMTGQISSNYSVGTWIRGCTNAILKATADGYNSLICAPIKSGNISISAWTAEDNLNFGYAKKGKTENSFDTRMYWDAPNNNLHAAAFTGHLYGTADNAINSDTVDGEHASNFSYTHQTSFDFNTSKSGRIVTFDQSGTDYSWINGFASTHGNYLTSVIFNSHRTSNWYVGYIEANTSTGKTQGLQAVHKLAFVDQIPTALKNPYALTISLNGTSQGPYDGSAAKSINITPGSIGAATSGHNHDGRYVYNYGGTQMDGASRNKNALGMSTTSGISGDWWHILQAAWNDEYRWNSQIAFPTQNRNGMYYRSGLDDNTKWGAWVKLLDTGNSYVTNGKGVINGTTITQVDNAEKLGGMSKNYGQSPFGTIPCVGGNGVMEIGRYIDYHYDNSGKYDFSTRLQTTGNYANVVNLPSASGTLALTSQVLTWKSQIIDMRNYSESYWHPVTVPLPNAGYNKIKVSVQLNSGDKPSWATHDSGITCNMEIWATSSGWGTTDSDTICLNYTYKFCSQNPCGWMQLTSPSLGVVFLRGGSRYTVYTDFDAVFTPHNQKYTWSNGSSSQDTGGPYTSCPGLNFNMGTIRTDLIATLVQARRVCAGHDPGIDNSISCSNWFRSSGNTGWYNTTYQGGWYMSDTSWIRAYNSVGIYTGGQIYSSSSVRAGNICLEHTDEINNITGGGVNLNYRNSGNVSLCMGGGKVGIGTMSPAYKLDVNGQVRASGFRHGSVNSNDYVLLAGGGYMIHKTGTTEYSTAIQFGKYVWLTIQMYNTHSKAQVVPGNISKPTKNIYVYGASSDRGISIWRISTDGVIHMEEGVSSVTHLYTTICYVASI